MQMYTRLTIRSMIPTSPKSIPQKYTQKKFISEITDFLIKGMGPDGVALGGAGFGLSGSKRMRLILEVENRIA